MSDEKKLRWRVPEGATAVEIVYDAETKKIKPKWFRRKAVDDTPGKTGGTEDTVGTKVSIGDHVRSFLTGEGPGAFSNPDDDNTPDVDEDQEGNGDDDG